MQRRLSLKALPDLRMWPHTRLCMGALWLRAMICLLKVKDEASVQHLVVCGGPSRQPLLEAGKWGIIVSTEGEYATDTDSCRRRSGHC